MTLIAVVALMWLVGLFAFAERVRGLTPPPEPARADAIVALTGPSAERVNAAIRLLEQDKGRRVLISGVNRDVRRKELRRGEVLEVRVHPDDMGRVIGKSGRTATALRTVLSALANGSHVRVDFLDVGER